MVERDLEDIPLERLLAELRARAGMELPAYDLSELSSQQLAVVVKALSGRNSSVPLSFHGEIDFTPRAQVLDPEVLKDMESVALVFFVEHEGDDHDLELPTRIFNEVYPLCRPAPFQLSRVVMGASSGVLVGPRLLATASHVIPSPLLMSKARVLFGFSEDMIVDGILRIPRERIFRPIGVVQRGNPLDWLLVDLDREVEGRTIRPIRREGKISDERAVHIVSHPRGMPAQYAPNARVRDNAAPGIFKADVDGLGGSSGAPIFDAHTHHIEGIYFKGLKDWDAMAVCNLLNQASPQASGEHIVRITELAPHIPLLH